MRAGKPEAQTRKVTCMFFASAFSRKLGIEYQEVKNGLPKYMPGIQWSTSQPGAPSKHRQQPGEHQGVRNVPSGDEDAGMSGWWWWPGGCQVVKKRAKQPQGHLMPGGASSGRESPKHR